MYVLHNPLFQRTQVLTYLMLPNLDSRVCSIDRPYRYAEQCDKVPYKGVRVPVSLDPVLQTRNPLIVGIWGCKCLCE